MKLLLSQKENENEDIIIPKENVIEEQIINPTVAGFTDSDNDDVEVGSFVSDLSLQR